MALHRQDLGGIFLKDFITGLVSHIIGVGPLAEFCTLREFS